MDSTRYNRTSESSPSIGILLSSCWTHKTYHHSILLINVPPSKALCLSTVWEVKPHTHTKHFDTAECITQQVNKQFLPLQTGHDKGLIFLILLTDLAVWLRNRLSDMTRRPCGIYRRRNVCCINVLSNPTILATVRKSVLAMPCLIPALATI